MRSSEFFAEAARMTVDAVKALAECFARAFLHVDGNEAGSTTGTRCYCNHDGKHFVTGDNNHCDYWEEAQ